METSKKFFFGILMAAVVVLVIINFSQNSRINNLEAVINNQFWQINNMERSIWNVSSMIASLNEQIEQMTEAARQSFGESFSIVSYNSETVSADVEITFNLKEFGQDDVITVYARGGQGTVLRQEAVHNGGGNFTAFMNLPLADNFDVNFAASGLTVRTGNLLNVGLANMLADRFHFTFGIGTTSSFGRSAPVVSYLTFLPHLVNQTNGDDAFKLNSVVFIFEVSGEVIYKLDFTSSLYLDGMFEFASAQLHAITHLRTHEPIISFRIADDRQFQTIDGGLVTGDYVVARLIMYDNLGIRYEQAEAISLAWAGHMVMAGGAGQMVVRPTPLPHRMFFAEPGSGRVLWHGEEPWHFIHIVKGGS